MIRARHALLALAASAFLLPDARADTLEAPVFSTMERDAYLEEYETFAGTVWEGTLLLYTRLDPALIDKIPGRVWTDEDREMAGCGYDYLAERDLLGVLDDFAANGVTIIEKIAADETITMLTVIRNPDALPGMMPGEEMTAAMLECGSLQLTAERMEAMGTNEAVLGAVMKAMSE